MANTAGQPVILIPSMGDGDMPDTPHVCAALRDRGATVLQADLSQNGNTFRGLPWHEIDVVDLRNMRGSLTNFHAYHGLLERIDDKIADQSQNGHRIVTIPDREAIHWIAYKAEYLTYLQDHGIDIVPTEVVRRHSQPNRPSTQPLDRIGAAIDETLTYMAGSDKGRFVLKPSVSALAKGLIFMERDGHGGFIVDTPNEEQADLEHLPLPHENALRGFLSIHFNTVAAPDDALLLQDYMENLETSCVFVHGRPHYVERSCGAAQIAHERYGGINTVIAPDAVDPRLTAFAQRVHAVLPDYVRRSPYLRIDVMWDVDSGRYLLAEIEGAGAARLWLAESGRAAEYADMLLLHAGCGPGQRLERAHEWEPG
jgi:hypothetical protein